MSPLDTLSRDVANLLRPPARLKLSEWADKHFYLSAEAAAEPGRWRTLPYQREIMDAITDPLVERVSVKKSARVGYTKIIDATVGYYADNDPCPIMVVQPTIEDAEGYSKDEIATMIRDCPRLQAIFSPATAKNSDNTILQKLFPGGSVSLVGANSPRGFRRVSRKVVIFDEVDGYPISAGTEGDQIQLGIKRTEYYWDRKIIQGSTPLDKTNSRIDIAFEEGDQRFYYVPCPFCEHKQVLKFSAPVGGFKWTDDDPKTTKYQCEACQELIDQSYKRQMVEQGEWRASKPFTGHASFHIWAAYSYSPNATWVNIADEFIKAKKKSVQHLKTFVNTTLGECWEDKGEAPEWEKLHDRREPYPIGEAPEGVLFITAGVDVQKDSLRYEVVGWGREKESWTIDAGVLPGDTASAKPWLALDALLDRPIKHARGSEMRIAMLAVDSGYNTQTVYNWGRRHPSSRVIAVKGADTVSVLFRPPTKVDVTYKGKTIARGYRVWTVGVRIAKAEFYGWLRLERPDASVGELFPPGFCHFPELDAEYFKQITAEHLVQRKNKGGFIRNEWEVIPGRENHFLDCRIYARVAAGVVGIDRFRDKDWDMLENQVGGPQRGKAPEQAPPAGDDPTPRGTFLGGRKGPGWLKGRNR
jgi:terminase, large subunit